MIGAEWGTGLFTLKLFLIWPLPWITRKTTICIDISALKRDKWYYYTVNSLLTLAYLVQIILMTHMHMDGQITQFNIPVNHHACPNMFWSVRTLCWWIRKSCKSKTHTTKEQPRWERVRASVKERAKSITHCLESFMTIIDISITLLEGEQTEKWWSHQQMH